MSFTGAEAVAVVPIDLLPDQTTTIRLIGRSGNSVGSVTVIGVTSRRLTGAAGTERGLGAARRAESRSLQGTGQVKNEGTLL